MLRHRNWQVNIEHCNFKSLSFASTVELMPGKKCLLDIISVISDGSWRAIQAVSKIRAHLVDDWFRFVKIPSKTRSLLQI